jgi:hypothetical protein
MFNPRIRIWRPHHASSEEASKFSELSADTRDLVLLMHQKKLYVNVFLTQMPGPGCKEEEAH